MNKNYTYKVWQMNHDEKTILQIANTHLILWDKGCCFIGYSNEKKVLISKYYVFEHDIKVSDLESVFMDEPIFGGDEPLTNIWMCTTRQHIIPKQLYKDPISKEWIKNVFFIDSSEKIFAVPVIKPIAYITFPLDNKLHSFVQDWFPNAIIDHIVNASFSDNQNQNMTLCLLPNIATLATFDSKHLLQYVIFEYSTVDEVLHKIGLAASANEMEHSDIKLDIIGFGEQKDAIANTVTKFFQVNNKSQEVFYNLLLACE